MTAALLHPTRRQATLLLLLTGTLWSSSGLFIKLISWGSFAILSSRSLVAMLVLLIYLRSFPLRWGRWQIVGAGAYVAMQLFFISSTKMTTAANAIFLQFTAPLYLVIFGLWFLGERPQRADWLSMPLIFAGMLLFFGDDLSLAGLWGNVFGILGGVMMALMITCLRRQKMGNPTYTILLGNVIAGLVGLPFLLQETFTPSAVGIIVYLGIFQLGLPLILYTIVIKYIPALEATLIVSIEPVLNPIWVFLVLGEVPGPLAFVGAVIVLGAVLTRAVISTRSEIVPAQV
jgi:drug/metabolite transporter (DMT)-like permease